MRAVHICVDPHKSAQENAQDYFRRYRKAKRGLAVQASRGARLEQAAETSDQQLRELEQAPDPQTLQRCLEKLPRQLKLLARPGSRCVHMAQRRARGAYLSTDGLEILVGQSAMHNEELTFKFARPQDLWLHAADYAGSHVIVRNPARREVPRRTVIEAAQLAAYFSGARAEGAADVRYTLCKYVQKVKGAAAGQVRLQRFNTIRVAPQKSVGKAGRNHLPPPDKCSYV
jgi:predicted ribosome quality control (RQC) complex YloA/Tae2 family protein